MADTTNLVDQSFASTSPAASTPDGGVFSSSNLVDQAFASSPHPVSSQTSSPAPSDENKPWWTKAWDWANEPLLSQNTYENIFGKPTGGFGRGTENVLRGFTSPLQLALTVGTMGSGSFIESAGAAALKETGEFTAEQMPEIVKGTQALLKAWNEDKPLAEAIKAAGADPELIQKAGNILHQAGLTESDLVGGNLVSRGTSALFRKFGASAAQGVRMSKTLQSAVDLGFSAQMLYQTAAAAPSFFDAWQAVGQDEERGDFAAAQEDRERMNQMLVEGGVTGTFGLLGLSHAKRSAGELFTGGKLKPSEQSRNLLSTFKYRDLARALAGNEAKNFEIDLRKQLGKKPEIQDYYDYYVKATVDKDTELARQSYNALMMAAGKPDRILPSGVDVLHQVVTATDKGNPEISTAVDEFARTQGLPPLYRAVVDVDDRAKAIAEAYKSMAHDPENPYVKRTYDALKTDIKNQFDYAIQKLGIKFEPSKNDPYKNSAEMMRDVRENKRLKFFQGGDIPADHPLAAIEPTTGFTYNELLRGVHDLFGHAAEGFEFGPKGEENAWNVHRQMFSPASIPALTTETKGQNSWVNFGKHLRNEKGELPKYGEEDFVPPSLRPFAKQKAGILPLEFWNRPDEKFSAIHYSTKPDLDVLRVDKFGTNGSLSAQERARSNEPGFRPRVYLGLEGAYYEPRIQNYPNRYKIPVDLKRYYDIEKDEKGLWKSDPTASENAVAAAGYNGYYSPSRGVLASFRDLEIPPPPVDYSPEGVRSSIQAAFPRVPAEQVEGALAGIAAHAHIFGLSFSDYLRKFNVRFEYGGEGEIPAGALAQAEPKPALDYTKLGEGKQPSISSADWLARMKAGQEALRTNKETLATLGRGANDTDYVQQARTELGAGATDSQVLLRAQELKDKAGDILYQTGQKNWYFLKSADILEQPGMMNAGSGEQWLATLRNRGVKEEEIKWTGLDDFLAGKKKITRDELQDFLRENEIQVKDVTLGEPEPENYVLPDSIRIVRRNDVVGQEAWQVQNTQGNPVLSREYPSQQAAEVAALTHYGDRRFGETKYASYQLPGGKNYRELLLTLPTHATDVIPAKGVRDPNPPIGNQDFHGGHFDEPNVLAHVRFNDRVDSEGKKVLFLEEVQSDWHQKGRREGYAQKANLEDVSKLRNSVQFLNKTRDEKWKQLEPLIYKEFPFAKKEDPQQIALRIANGENGGVSPEIDRLAKEWKSAIYNRQRAEQELYKAENPSGVPDAPFKSDWHELALKRMLRYAAENGYDKLAWTPGEVQNERYDLSKHIETLYYKQNPDGTYQLRLKPVGASPAAAAMGEIGNRRLDAIPAKELAEYVGKDVAERVVSGKGEERTVVGDSGYERQRVLSGLDLKVGGSGMKGFYDKIISDFLNKYGKKWGARVDKSEISTNHETERVFMPGADSEEKLGNIARGAFGTLRTAANNVYNSMAEMSFRQAMEEYGTEELANALGGKYIHQTKPTPVPSIPITPSMKDSVMGKGQPLFQKSNQVIKGATEFLKDGGAIIRGYASGDLSTLIHETAHVFRRNLPAELRTLAEKAYNVQSGNWTREQEESFARDNETYHMEGKSPVPQLNGVFQKFKEWLGTIYRNLVNSPVGGLLPPEKRELFDRMYGAKKVVADAEFNHPRLPDNIRELVTKSKARPEEALRWAQAYKRTIDDRFDDNERAVLKSVRDKLNDGWAFAHEHGVLNKAVENYLPRLYKRSSPNLNELLHSNRLGNFSTNATMARHRVFQTDLESVLRGYERESVDPIALAAKWTNDLKKIVADREFLDNLREKGIRGSDGRPAVVLAGTGTVKEGSHGENPATFVNPARVRSIKIAEPVIDDLKKSGMFDRYIDNGTIRETKNAKGQPVYLWEPQDYVNPAHPAFRDWNYATAGPDGSPVWVKAEMRLHPEFAEYVKRRLGIDESPLRQWPVTKALMGAGGEAKHLMLSLSPFHLVQEGLRGLMMGVSPFRLDRVRLADRPVLQKLVRNEMTLEPDYKAVDEFSEGVASHSKILSKVPLIGRYQDWFQDFLFNRYIPSLKARAGELTFDKMTKAHPEWSEDRAATETARLMNDVFGGQNWRAFGRSTATQDWFRIMSLAPDWLESEVRFASRIFSKDDTITRAQVVKMAFGLWGVARVLNMISTGKPHNEAPFGVAYKDDQGREKVVSVRTLPTDMLHMATDPIGFLKGRASPALRTAQEVYSGRDQFGKKLSPGDLVADVVSNLTPIPVQTKIKQIGGIKAPDVSNPEQAMKATGLTVSPYRTEAQKMAANYASNHAESGMVEPNQIAKHQLMQEWENRIRSGQMKLSDVSDMRDRGVVAEKDFETIRKNIQETKEIADPDLAKLYMRVSRLPMKETLDVWNTATANERVALSKLMFRKAQAYMKKARKDMTPTERMSDSVFLSLRKMFPENF